MLCFSSTESQPYAALQGVYTKPSHVGSLVLFLSPVFEETPAQLATGTTNAPHCILAQNALMMLSILNCHQAHTLIFELSATAMSATSDRPKVMSSVPQACSEEQSGAQPAADVRDDDDDATGNLQHPDVSDDIDAAQAGVPIGPSMPAIPSADAAEANGTHEAVADTADVPEVQPASGATC